MPERLSEHQPISPELAQPDVEALDPDYVYDNYGITPEQGAQHVEYLGYSGTVNDMLQKCEPAAGMFKAAHAMDSEKGSANMFSILASAGATFSEAAPQPALSPSSDEDDQKKTSPTSQPLIKKLGETSLPTN